MEIKKIQDREYKLEKYLLIISLSIIFTGIFFILYLAINGFDFTYEGYYFNAFEGNYNNKVGIFLDYLYEKKI